MLNPELQAALASVLVPPPASALPASEHGTEPATPARATQSQRGTAATGPLSMASASADRSFRMEDSMIEETGFGGDDGYTYDPLTETPSMDRSVMAEAPLVALPPVSVEWVDAAIEEGRETTFQKMAQGKSCATVAAGFHALLGKLAAGEAKSSQTAAWGEIRVIPV